MPLPSEMAALRRNPPLADRRLIRENGGCHQTGPPSSHSCAVTGPQSENREGKGGARSILHSIASHRVLQRAGRQSAQPWDDARHRPLGVNLDLAAESTSAATPSSDPPTAPTSGNALRPVPVTSVSCLRVATPSMCHLVWTDRVSPKTMRRNAIESSGLRRFGLSLISNPITKPLLRVRLDSISAPTVSSR